MHRTNAPHARGDVAGARAALAALQALKDSVPAQLHAGENPLVAVIRVAVPVLDARIAATEHRNADAVTLLTQAVAAEDALSYDEPADWFFPVRQLLGAQLLLMGEPQAAEAVYREDLGAIPTTAGRSWGSRRRSHSRDVEPGAPARRAPRRAPGSTPTAT